METEWQYGTFFELKEPHEGMDCVLIKDGGPVPDWVLEKMKCTHRCRIKGDEEEQVIQFEGYEYNANNGG